MSEASQTRGLEDGGMGSVGNPRWAEGWIQARGAEIFDSVSEGVVNWARAQSVIDLLLWLCYREEPLAKANCKYGDKATIKQVQM